MYVQMGMCNMYLHTRILITHIMMSMGQEHTNFFGEQPHILVLIGKLAARHRHAFGILLSCLRTLPPDNPAA